MNRKPCYKKLIGEREKILTKLAETPPVLRGTLRKHKNKCGNSGCRCHAGKDPVLHGPYQYLSHRHKDKTQTILLTKEKLPYAGKWVKNYKQLIKLIYRLSEINFRLLRYHHDKLDVSE